jgi:hypothetical protein
LPASYRDGRVRFVSCLAVGVHRRKGMRLWSSGSVSRSAKWDGVRSGIQLERRPRRNLICRSTMVSLSYWDSGSSSSSGFPTIWSGLLVLAFNMGSRERGRKNRLTKRLSITSASVPAAIAAAPWTTTGTAGRQTTGWYSRRTAGTLESDRDAPHLRQNSSSGSWDAPQHSQMRRWPSRGLSFSFMIAAL